MEGRGEGRRGGGVREGRGGSVTFSSLLCQAFAGERQLQVPSSTVPASSSAAQESRGREGGREGEGYSGRPRKTHVGAFQDGLQLVGVSAGQSCPKVCQVSRTVYHLLPGLHQLRQRFPTRSHTLTPSHPHSITN